MAIGKPHIVPNSQMKIWPTQARFLAACLRFGGAAKAPYLSIAKAKTTKSKRISAQNAYESSCCEQGQRWGFDDTPKE